ncbi:hypothetical protein Nepgr_022247 [Nepenthes gracilis]|uniref:Xyloglucan endotransglucosylase/hydrolase n=1 Tax=Nepenthes gracilis TaxID=150966 RepID=A0AAD3T282_NEPGR|nr:hypothetical protein Nepgr_022247 [Nepenthes gracilis]
MDSLDVKLVVLLLLIMMVQSYSQSDSIFYDNYRIMWGDSHALVLSQGTEVQLSLDSSSGSGFGSKLFYGSGYINMSIKLSDKLYTGGLVTALFMSSSTNNRDELDLEFLGHIIGKLYMPQTNIFVNGVGGREQRINLWFNPSADFHSYSILWNQHQVVFYVDSIPIRVFKNQQEHGIPYVTQPMQILTSLWNGDTWATDGGRAKMNYNYSPFDVHFKGFGINGCPPQINGFHGCPTQINGSYGCSVKIDGAHGCYSSEYWWNGHQYWRLNFAQQRAYETVKSKYMSYDYCKDENRYPSPPPECTTK